MKTKKAIIVSVILLLTLTNAYSQAWRSNLYPVNWHPWYKVETKFLHDFSYAGYNYGTSLDEVPTREMITVVADKTGATDVTAIIQKAINDLPAAGGIVYLPTGTYKVSPQNGAASALFINKNNVILKGNGTANTKIFNSSTSMREKSIISIKLNDNIDWYGATTSQVKLRTDAIAPTKTIFLEWVSGFSLGDRIVLRTDMTDAFITDHNMTGGWFSTNKGITFVRQIKSINTTENSITLDVPIRYYLKTRDNARIYKLSGQITNCGVENLAIGNVNRTENLEEFENTKLDFDDPNKPAYLVHHASVIKMKNAENCWVRNVSTYKPQVNTKGFHVLSNGIDVDQCRLISIQSCNFQKPQYRGEGGNGYMFQVNGNDCLFNNCEATNARHSFSFKLASSNGNVIYNCKSTTPKLGTDFHQVLSVANLIDNFTCESDFIDAQYRPYGSTYTHGHTTSESVIWNTYGNGAYHANSSSSIVVSGQFGNGYVIGTYGPNKNVKILETIEPAGSTSSAPKDYLEGLGTGGTNLHPVSLYIDQRIRRTGGTGYDKFTTTQKTSLTSTKVHTDSDASSAEISQDLASDDLLNQKEGNNELLVYPVPAQDKINVTFPKNIKSKMIVMYNSSGQKVLEKSILDNNVSILVNISVLNTGVYTLQLICEKNLSTKVIKK